MSLSQDARLGLGMQVIRGLAGDGDRAGLGGVAEVAVAAGLADLAPAIGLDELEDLTDLHASLQARARMVSSFDLENTIPDWALCFRWDIVLRGREATPLDEDKH